VEQCIQRAVPGRAPETGRQAPFEQAALLVQVLAAEAPVQYVDASQVVGSPTDAHVLWVEEDRSLRAQLS